MFAFTNELAQGNIIPSENIPNVGPIKIPMSETAAGNISPIKRTTKMKENEMHPVITLTALDTWKRTLSFISGLSLST